MKTSAADRVDLTFAVAAAVAILIVVLLSVAPVAAHAYLSESTPSNGERLDEEPSEVVLSYTGDSVVEAEASVEGPNGEDVSGEAATNPEDDRRVVVPVEAEGDGMYVVEWEVLADDGHTTSGTFFYTVGDEPLDTDAVMETYDDAEVDEGISLLEAGAKALMLLSLVVLVGATATFRFVLDGIGLSSSAADRRLDVILVGACVALAVSTVSIGVMRAASFDSLGGFASSSLGIVWVAQVFLAAGAVAFAAASWRERTDRRLTRSGVFAAAAGFTLTVGWTSHSATAIGRLRGTVVDAAHVFGAGFWLGGLMLLAVVFPPLLRSVPPEDRAGTAADVVRRYSVLALAGVTAAVSTGLVLTAWHVPDLSGFVETVYGTALSAKVALVLLALGIGGFVRFVVVRSLDADRSEADAVGTLRRGVNVEVAVVVAVVVLSGVVTSAATPAVVGDAPEETTIEAGATDAVDVHLSVFPTYGGADDVVTVPAGEPTVFVAEFVGEDGTVQSDGTVPLLATDGETEVEVELEQDDGAYTAVQPFPHAGNWEVRVTGSPDGSFVSAWFEFEAVEDDGSDHEHDESEGGDHGHGNSHNHVEDVEDVAAEGVEVDISEILDVGLRAGAVLMAVFGSLAVGIESTKLRRRGGEK